MVDLKNLSGFLNTDDSNEVMDGSHHKMAVNGRFRGSGKNLRFERTPGTTLIENELPDGDNECIGAFYDPVKRRVFWFVWNADGNNSIFMRDLAGQITYTLFQDTANAGENVLQFSPDFPVSMVHIIYRSEDQGDILLFNDRLNRPRKLNVQEGMGNTYGSSWTAEILTVARPMPLIAPVCSYQDDSTVSINNLRKKLYQFRYRWIYSDDTKSTPSPYGKLFAPADPDDIAVEIDPEKNNAIDMIVNTGPADCRKVEIIGRVTQGDTENTSLTSWSDNLRFELLDKDELGLADNTLYTYRFYGNQVALSMPVEEAIQLFDYVPKKANAQELLNGNVITYGGVTYGNTYEEEQDVDYSIELVDNQTTSDPFTISLVNSQTGAGPPFGLYGGAFYYYFQGTPVAGDEYKIWCVLRFSNGTDPATTEYFEFSYTALLGDQPDDVRDAFVIGFNGLPFFNSTYNMMAAAALGSPVGMQFYSLTGESTVMLSQGTVTYNTPVTPSPNDVNIACFKHKSYYQFGRVYFDQYGMTNGVVTMDSLRLQMPEIDTTGQTPMQIPAISFEVNDQPPIWATSFSWVRTDSLTFQRSLPIVSTASSLDMPNNQALIEITGYQDMATAQKWPVYSYTPGDRVRIIGAYGSAVTTVYDFPVLELRATGGQQWIIVEYDAVLSFFGGQLYTEVYTPALNQTESLQTFYEFGETYPVLFPGEANRAHGGQIQDQIFGVQPATYNFVRGDFYIRLQDATWIIAQSISYQYPSTISGTGRAFVVDPFARETYYPTQYRYGGAYQQDTNLNNTNRFYGESFDEVDRQKGDIECFVSRERLLVILQKRGVGRVGVYAKFIQDSTGDNILTTSNTIITQNNIDYYKGDFGVGNQYTAVTKNSVAIKFIDPNRGYEVRIAENGMTPISLEHKGQFYIQPKFLPYNRPYLRSNGYKAKIISCFDYRENEWVTHLQAGSIEDEEIDNYTFSFNESRKSYSNFFQFSPEWMVAVENEIYMFLNGEMWAYNNTTTWSNFFGQQYDSKITLVFNKEEPVTRTFLSLSYQSGGIWTSSADGDIVTSMINSETGMQQSSNLIARDYEVVEHKKTASFWRDKKSGDNPFIALLEGDDLKGQWIEVTFTYTGSEFAYFYAPFVNYVISQRNF